MKHTTQVFSLACDSAIVSVSCNEEFWINVKNISLLRDYVEVVGDNGLYGINSNSEPT